MRTPEVSKGEDIVWQMDCLRGMRDHVAAASIDVVVTSPPYNLGINYTKYVDQMTHGQCLDWCVEWSKEIRRVLKPDGSFFLNLGGSPTNPTMPHELLCRLVSETEFQLQNTIHWIKSITVTDD